MVGPANKFAKWLNHLVTAKAGAQYNIKDLKLRHLYRYQRRLKAKYHTKEEVLPGLLEHDDTHLSTWGYRVFTMSAFLPLIDKWYSECKPPGSEIHAPVKRRSKCRAQKQRD